MSPFLRIWASIDLSAGSSRFVHRRSAGSQAKRHAEVMPRRPAPLPDALGQAFTFTDAIALGVTPGRLRHRSLITPTPGIRLTDRATDLRVRAAAVVKILPPGAAFSHQTGAALLRLPAPEDD